MRLLADPLHLFPVDVPVQPDPDPAAVADVRRPEEPAGFRDRQFLLGAGWRGAPQMRELMVVVPVGPQHDELPADEERRRAVTLTLLAARQREADRPDAVLDGPRVGFRTARVHDS